VEVQTLQIDNPLKLVIKEISFYTFIEKLCDVSHSKLLIKNISINIMEALPTNKQMTQIIPAELGAQEELVPHHSHSLVASV
jgi:hypothetical protein